jgi:hypothetical protein
MAIVTLATDSPPAGDANGDGRVSLADAAYVTRRLGSLCGASNRTGDLDDDGAVTLADLLAVRTHLANGSAGSPTAGGLTVGGLTVDGVTVDGVTVDDPSVAVPEPSTATLLLLGIAGIGILVRRRYGGWFADERIGPLSLERFSGMQQSPVIPMQTGTNPV